MKKAGIFPFRLSAYDTAYYTASPTRYQSAFLKTFRPCIDAGMTWFAFDVIVKSRTEVEFVAYDMRDSCSGGLGKEIWRGEATVPYGLTVEDVDGAILEAAKSRRREYLRRIEDAAIEQHVVDIRKELEGGAQ